MAGEQIKITIEDVKRIRERYGVSLSQTKRMLEKGVKANQLNHLIDTANSIDDLKAILRTIVEDLYRV